LQLTSWKLSHTARTKCEKDTVPTLRPTLDGSRVQIPRNQFGLIWSKLNPWVWTLPWTLVGILILQIISSPFQHKKELV
jgi:hypothetical protein